MVKVVDRTDAGRGSRDPKKGRFMTAERPPMMYLAVEVMEASGLSDSEISRRTGLGANTISNVRNLVTRNPQAKTLEFILTKGCGFEMAIFSPKTSVYTHVNFDIYGRKKR